METINSTTTRQKGRTTRHRRATSAYRKLAAVTPKYSEVGREPTEHLLNLWRADVPLRESQRQFIWCWFDDMCLSVFARKFGKSIPQARSEVENVLVKNEAHLDRILLCMQFFQNNKHRGIGWCITAYRVRFHLFEAKRYMESLGVDLEQKVQGARNLTFAQLLRLVRINYTELGEVPPYELLNLYINDVGYVGQVKKERVREQCQELCQALAIRYTKTSLDEHWQSK
jgi:hypothetical protein